MNGVFDSAQAGASSSRVAHDVTRQPAALREVTGFGVNPGALRMWTYRPASARKKPVLVVVLHGCTQTAAGYDLGAGWSKLADQAGFLLLFPEQQTANNPRTCFNWFNPQDARRDQGEAASIRAMIAHMIDVDHADPTRVFICGLSAGGAMTAVMLAAYPETFKAGAIIAGLPFGAASSVGEALESMYTGRIKSAKTWGDLVRAAPGREPVTHWPAVSIWHGTADKTVKPINAGELVKQWTDVHGLGGASPDESHVGTVTRRAWSGSDGCARVIEYSVPEMGHGTPIVAEDETGADMPVPFFLSAGIWSSLAIAQDWRLIRRDGASRRAPFRLLGLEF